MTARLRAALFVLTAVAGAALAQSSGNYDLHWNVVGGGGGLVAGGNSYALNGTIAQAEANSAGEMSGGNGYTLRGGFWVAGSGEIFKNGFETP